MNEHPSHDWWQIEDGDMTLMCSECFACTCCTPVEAESPCTHEFIEGEA